MLVLTFQNWYLCVLNVLKSICNIVLFIENASRDEVSRGEMSRNKLSRDGMTSTTVLCSAMKWRTMDWVAMKWPWWTDVLYRRMKKVFHENLTNSMTFVLFEMYYQFFFFYKRLIYVNFTVDYWTCAIWGDWRS